MESPKVDPTEDPNRQNLKIMVLGKTGSGKSTFINSVFGKRIATTRRGFREQEHPTLEKYRTEINGVHLTFYDTRGIGYGPEETQTILDDIREEFSSGSLRPDDLDLFLICVKLTESLTQETLDAIRDIKKVCDNFLQRCIVVCTFTNMFEDDAKRHEPNISRQELAREIDEQVEFLSSKIQNTWHDVPAEAYSEIPFINVGWKDTNNSSRGKEELKLSTSDNWIHDFFDVCSRRCPEKHLEPLTKVAVKCVPCEVKVKPPERKHPAAAIAGGIGMILIPVVIGFLDSTLH